MLSTRNAVLLLPSAFAFGLALAAAPAAATVRTAPYTWTPSSGPVAGYLLYLSVDGGPEENYGYVSQPNAVVLVESGAEVVVSVAAFDAAGRVGPRSNPSPPLRLCPGDFDGDEEVEQTDMNRAIGCFQKPATGACAAADLNGDGFVSGSDIQGLEVGADACQQSCPGDMDGDGVLSASDVLAMKSCIGLYAEGNCTNADFNGSGFVNNTDVIYANRQIGTVCSN